MLEKENYLCMFPDSKIAKQFQMSKTKASYLICRELAP